MANREVERITDQLRGAFEGNAWHGPALSEVLSDVTSAPAGDRFRSRGKPLTFSARCVRLTA
jgi:hypothetical protein